MDHLRRGLARRTAPVAPPGPGVASPAPTDPPTGASPTPPPPASSLFPARPANDAPVASACRYLGLRDDPGTHFAYPSPLNRCHASGQPETVDGAYQAGRCLTDSHGSCPRYAAAIRFQQEATSGRSRRADAGSRTAGGGTAGAGAVAPPADRDVGAGDTAPAPGPSTLRQVVRYLLLLVVMLVLGFALAVTLLLVRPSSLGGFIGPTASAASTLAPGPATLAPSLPAEAPTMPAATSTASPTPVPTPTPTPRHAATPTPPRVLVYYVQRGDTLISIATRFGITVDALQRANGLGGSLLQVGQRLIVPLR